MAEGHDFECVEARRRARRKKIFRAVKCARQCARRCAPQKKKKTMLGAKDLYMAMRAAVRAALCNVRVTDVSFDVVKELNLGLRNF
jgi:aminoglycoside phosphotransferase family enzyme